MDKNHIKIALAFAFLLSLFDMPYWYYQSIRLFGTIGLAYLAYLDYQSKYKITPLIFGGFAIFLNPFFKITFRRSEWNIIDVIFAVILIASIFLETRPWNKK